MEYKTIEFLKKEAEKNPNAQAEMFMDWITPILTEAENPVLKEEEEEVS